MQKDKAKDNSKKTTKEAKMNSRSFKNEIIMLLLFVVAGVGLILIKFDGWLSLSVLIVGLVSLYFNDINKWLDLIVGLLWSGLYCYFSIQNGLMAQAILVSAFYLFINIYDLFNNADLSTIVQEKNKLKVYQIVALCVVSVAVAVGTFFLVSIWSEQKLAIFDVLVAVLLCISLYMMLKRCPEYFVVRLIAMIGTVLLWIIVGFLYGFGTGCLNIALMFIAFIIYDNIRIRKWTASLKRQKEDSIYNTPEFREAELKSKKMSRKGLPTKSVGVDKDDERK